jgi:lysine biosynthesis protein LysW
MGVHRKHKARCPFCFAYIHLHDYIEVWDILTCEECETPLQVVNLHPPELDYIDDEDLEYVDYWEEDDWEGHQFSQN